MRRLFDLNSPLMSFLVKAFDCVCLSVLWVLFSLPVVTLGVASAALYTVVHRCLQKRKSIRCVPSGMLFCGAMAIAAPGLAMMLPAPICWLGSRTMEQILRLHMQPEDLERETENCK